MTIDRNPLDPKRVHVKHALERERAARPINTGRDTLKGLIDQGNDMALEALRDPKFLRD